MRARVADGFDLMLPVADLNLVEMILRGVLFEVEVANALRQHLRKGDTFVDGGAHVGLYTLMGAKEVGEGGRVIAFEPNPLNAGFLRFNVARSGFGSTVTVEEAGIGAETGTALFNWSPSLSTHGRFLGSPAPDSQVTPVQTMDLDGYLSRNGSRADLIKLDLEGGEPQALHGMTRSLSYARCVIMEVNAPRLREQGMEPSSIVTLAMQLGGFREVRVLPLGGGAPQPVEYLRTDLATHGWSNVLFTRDKDEDRLEPDAG